ncbi:SURF1 family cytochrome oxidase biogenesis protein [Nesterenkonia populi]
MRELRQRYAFLATPTWIGWFAVCALFMVVCYFLGQWQWDRREATLDEIGTIQSNYDQDPIPYAEARDIFDSADEDDEWKTVDLTGEYLSEDHLFARNRPHSGQVGYEQVVPFRESSTGDVVVISRGWLAPASEDGSLPESNPEPPSGRTEVTVRIKPGEPEISRGAPEGQLASIELAEMESQVGYDLMTGAYGEMASESPQPAEQPRAFPRPSVDEGPHLSYSMQWIAFGMLSFVGWGYAARLQARSNDLGLMGEDEDGGPAGISKRERLREARAAQRRRQGRFTDEDAEDAWVDQHLSDRS